ncbi:FCD domain-containing protein [Streptomyces triticagri]|uniref:FCD domain-containing protein n=1 Tax=Streptomyces triticagri TaxID=2293568 RepID=UPI002691DCFB
MNAPTAHLSGAPPPGVGDIALHAAVVGAAHNPVLTGLFEEFVPVLQSGLTELLDLLELRAADPAHGDASHAALVEAVVRGDADAAGRVLREELRGTLERLQAV